MELIVEQISGTTCKIRDFKVLQIMAYDDMYNDTTKFFLLLPGYCQNYPVSSKHIKKQYSKSFTL